MSYQSDYQDSYQDNRGGEAMSCQGDYQSDCQGGWQDGYQSDCQNDNGWQSDCQGGYQSDWQNDSGYQGGQGNQGQDGQSWRDAPQWVEYDIARAVEAGLPSLDAGTFLISNLIGAADFVCCHDESSIGARNARDMQQVREGLKQFRPRDIDALLIHARELETLAEHCEDEGKRMALRGKEYREGAAFLRQLLLEAMEGAGKKRVSGILQKAVIQESARVKAPEDMAALEALGEIDPGLVKGKLVADKTAIKKALQAGRDLPGCALEKTRHLRCGAATSIRI